MLVCPNCRRDNPEEAQFCSFCGRNLAPDISGLGRRVKREERPDAFEIPVPKPPSPLPGIITLGVVAIALGVLGTWLALRPNPCEGKFTSDRYPYCVAIPEGWREGAQEIGGTTADAYRPQTERAVVLVVAEEVDPGTNTEAYAEVYRDNQEQGGLFPGPARRILIGGSEAVAWEITGTTEEGTSVRQRQLTIVRDGMGWVITFAGATEGYREHRPIFESMLESWAWK
jgi:zinc-ribbon domain